MPELRELTTDAEWDAAVPILRQLWSHRDESFVRSWCEEDDYRLFGWYAAVGSGAPSGSAAHAEGATVDDPELVAVAGISIQRVLHHERHLWIHDFVVDEPRRGEGHGAALLDRLAAWARERYCEHLSLACDADNDDAYAFYEAEGLEEWGSVLEAEL